MKTWLITGASGGLGHALARHVLARGDRVIAGARRPETLLPLTEAHPSTTLALTIDVDDAASIETAIAAALDWAPEGIDVLVNNAGRGLHGAVEEVSDAEARALFETNVFGLLTVTRAVLPGMRKRGSGHIINIGSVAGITADAGTGLYSATKFALEGISEAMHAELAPLGIKVTIVEPGPFRTEFNGGSIRRAETVIPDYAPTAGKRTDSLRAGSGQQAGDPARLAALLSDIVDTKNPPLHLVVGEAAMGRAGVKLERLTEEIARWAEPSRATRFS